MNTVNTENAVMPAVSGTHQVAPVLPRSFDEIRAMAEYIARSNLCPKEFRGRPADVAVAIMHGLELGLKPLQALRNITVINGRPTVWGDAALALVLASPACEYVKEEVRGEGEAMKAVCQVKRRGHPAEVIRTFSVADAKRAGLWGKPGPWRDYPQRMLQLRARSWALRDAFPDLLSGLYLTEEAMDIPADTVEVQAVAAEPVAESEPEQKQEQKQVLPEPALKKAQAGKEPEEALVELAKIRQQILNLLIQAGLSQRDMVLVAKVLGPVRTVQHGRGVLNLLQTMAKQHLQGIKRFLQEAATQQDLPMTIKDAAVAWEAFLATLPTKEEVQKVRAAFQGSEFAQLLGQSEQEFAAEVVGKAKPFDQLARPQLQKIAKLLKVDN